MSPRMVRRLLSALVTVVIMGNFPSPHAGVKHSMMVGISDWGRTDVRCQEIFPFANFAFFARQINSLFEMRNPKIHPGFRKFSNSGSGGEKNSRVWPRQS